jgi:hypothetical protein
MISQEPGQVDGLLAGIGRRLVYATQQHAAGRHVTGDYRAGRRQRACIGRTRVVTPAVFCAEAL